MQEAQAGVGGPPRESRCAGTGKDGIISSRDEIFPVNSLVAYPYLAFLLETKRKLEETGGGDRLRDG